MLHDSEGYQFGEFTLDCGRGRLSKAGRPISLRAKSFALLHHFVTHADQLIAKDDLMSALWPNAVVSDDSLTQCVSDVRAALGDGEHQLIRTLPRRGYLFAPTVTRCGAEADVSTSSHLPSEQPPPGTFATYLGILRETLLSNAGAFGGYVRKLARDPGEPILEPGRPATASAPEDAWVGNLPSRLARLHGRDEDVRNVTALVEAHSVVTIAGAGGIGKTRLAQAVAHRLGGRWTDGVWFVELAAITDGELVPATVAHALGIQLSPHGHARQSLIVGFKTKAMLLVLDNCEHLLDAISTLIEDVTASAPFVHIIATSQEPLKVGCERLYRLGTLGVPASVDLSTARNHGAVDLFVERVRAVESGFELDANNVDDVVDICRQLDGVALAIELAAARVPLLGVAGVRDRLGERFRLLTGGARTALRRHQTLRAAQEWSHNLLSLPEQIVFRRLGVFSGGFGLALAQSVLANDQLDAWAVLEHLGALVDKSLLIVDHDEPPRYRLLESSRAYALERLADAGETAAWLHRHAWGVRELLERTIVEVEAGRLTIDAHFARWVPEFDNLRTAVEWAMAPGGEVEIALSLAAHALSLIRQHGPAAKSRSWYTALRKHVNEATAPTLAARFWLAMGIATDDGSLSPDARIEVLDRAVALLRRCDDGRLLAHTLSVTAYVHGLHNDFVSAHACLDEVQRIERADWPALLRAWLLMQRGWVFMLEGRLTQALAALESVLPLFQAAGNTRRLLHALVDVAGLHLMLGRVDDAVFEFRALAALDRKFLHDGVWTGMVLTNLTRALTAQGSLDAAHAVAAEAIRHVGHSFAVRSGFEAFAWLAARQGRLPDAARLLGAKDAWAGRNTQQHTVSKALGYDETLALIKAVHAVADIEQWGAEGASLDDDALTRLVLGPPVGRAWLP